MGLKKRRRGGLQEEHSPHAALRPDTQRCGVQDRENLGAARAWSPVSHGLYGREGGERMAGEVNGVRYNRGDNITLVYRGGRSCNR